MNTKSYTKADLVAIIERQTAEIEALRREVSISKVQPAPVEVKEHEYASYDEASERCKALVAWDTEHRFVFTQRGCKVICKPRATH
jgi:hypothetical protein